MNEADSGATGDSSTEPALSCPWCAAPAAAGAIHCSTCGAALAQRDSIGGVQIPGLTSVDPALADFDKRPLRLRGPSPSHGVASSLILGAVAGGPIGLVAIGGVAAVAAAELLGTRHEGPASGALEDLGKPSESTLQALEHLDESTSAMPDATAGATPADMHDHPIPTDGESSIWRDLPA